jgi:hypothetical protein
VVFQPRYERAVANAAPKKVAAEKRLEPALWAGPIYAISFFWFGYVRFDKGAPPMLTSTVFCAQMDVVRSHKLLVTIDVIVTHGIGYLLALRKLPSISLSIILTSAVSQLGLFNYMIDTYLAIAASALAGNTVVRSIFGAVFPVCLLLCYFQPLTD